MGGGLVVERTLRCRVNPRQEIFRRSFKNTTNIPCTQLIAATTRNTSFAHFLNKNILQFHCTVRSPQNCCHRHICVRNSVTPPTSDFSDCNWDLCSVIHPFAVTIQCFLRRQKLLWISKRDQENQLRQRGEEIRSWKSKADFPLELRDSIIL